MEAQKSAVQTQAAPPPIQATEQHLASVAVADPANGQVQLTVPTERGQYVSNYRIDVPDEAISFSRAIAPSDCRLDIHADKVIAVKGIVVNMAEFERSDGSGEVDEKPYMSLVLADDSVIGTTGKAVVSQVLLAIRSCGLGEWNPPVLFEVRRHKSAPPKQDYYSVRRARPALPLAKKAGGK